MRTNLARTDTDVLVIGGGPAGSAMAGYLAKAGVDVVLLERELFPRPHVGESLVPASNRVFDELGFLDTMEGAGFPRKYGAVWTSAGNGRAYDHEWEGLGAHTEADVAFSERRQQGVYGDYTWHVDRGRFDTLLLQHAASLGAQVVQGVHVRDVTLDLDRPAEVSYRVGRQTATLTAQVVVDASGRRTVVGQKKGWKVPDPVFNQYAVHTWFDGYDRSAVTGSDEKLDYIHIHFLPIANSWVWQIPITDTITSVGVVTQKQLFKQFGGDREAFFWKFVDTRPEFAAALRDAVQLRDFTTDGDYSYSMTQVADDRTVLIGDAARFVDPIFSSGVSIALTSASLAAPTIVDALERGDVSAASFQPYVETIRRGTRNWYEFISLYYRLNVLFTAFIRDERYRLDVLKLLQGDVYDEQESPVLVRMRELVRAVEDNPDHVWHGLLGDLTATGQSPTF